jgi:hypothetical protein
MIRLRALACFNVDFGSVGFNRGDVIISIFFFPPAKLFHINFSEDVYDVLFSHHLPQLFLLAHPTFFLSFLRNVRAVKV